MLKNTMSPWGATMGTHTFAGTDYGTLTNLAIVRRGLVFDGHLFGVLTHLRISPCCSQSRAIMDIDNSALGSWILALGALLGCEQKR